MAQVGATFDASESDPHQGGEVVEELMEDPARVAVRHERPGLAVFVDEFQELPLADRASVLHALQHFDGAPHGGHVAVVAAGLPSLPDAVVEAATFGERSTFQDLNLLSDVPVAEALRLPAEASEVTWTNEAVEAAIQVAQGYPHMVQLIGQQTWERAWPERGATIEAGMVRAGAEGAHERVTTLYKTRLSKSSPEEQRFLHAMAEEGDTAISRRAIAQRLGVESNALSRPRDGLIGRGIIEPDGRGTVRFTVPGFGDYLRAVTADDPGRTSWNQDI